MLSIPSNDKTPPPFVRFEMKEYGLNVAASEDAGRPIPHVVAMACITPHGSKDVYEKPAEDWLRELMKKAALGQYNPEWAQRFKAQFEAWKQGEELPREGTPTATWAAATAEQRARLKAIGFTTVEDLAAVPDSGLGLLGLDGRALRDLARGWINEAKDKGINAKAIADANVKIETLERKNAEQREEISALLARLEQLESAAGIAGPKKGRAAAAA